jgi:hypothetical protein
MRCSLSLLALLLITWWKALNAGKGQKVARIVWETFARVRDGLTPQQCAALMFQEADKEAAKLTVR